MLNNIFKTRKQLWIFIILVNFAGITSFAYSLYFKKALFDDTKKPIIETSSITKIDIREGHWRWENREWEFSRDSKLVLTGRNEIETFCSTLKSSRAKYIDNIRPDYWLYIYFTSNNKEELSVVLKQNYQNEIFVEYDGNTYEGTSISLLIQTLADKLEKDNKLAE